MTMAEYKPLKKCPNCKSKKITRDFQSDLPTGTVKKGDSEITVGQLADRNRDRFSEDKKLSLYHKNNSYLWEGDDEKIPKLPPPDKLPKPRPITRKLRPRKAKLKP